MRLVTRMARIVGGSALVAALLVVGNLAAMRRDHLRLDTEAAMDLAVTLLRMQVESRDPTRPASGLAWRRGLEALRESRHLTVSIAVAGRPGATIDAGRIDAPGVPDWFITFMTPSEPLAERRVALENGSDEIVLRVNPAREIAEAWREFCVLLGILFAFAAIAGLWMFVDLRRGLVRLAEVGAALRQFELGNYAVRVAASDRPEVDEVAGSFNHMAEALARGQADMRELAQRSLAIREDERRHLAHELHDGIGQSISAIKALAVSIARKAKPDSGIGPSAMMIADVSSSMYDQVRTMMDRLRPSILDELGLASAIGSMIDSWNTHHEHMFCSFEYADPLPILPPDASINVFRIVQEALTNVVKHAEASSVSVRLYTRASHGELVLEIEDDGRGFDAAAARRGLGLVGIEERVRAIGGSLRLASAPGRGTRFEISIPFKQDKSDEHTVHENQDSAG
jgi:two-component system sensor histidine kinase UhpB